MKAILTEATVIGIKETKSKDLSKTYYSVTLEQDGDVLSFACDVDVVSKLKKYGKYDVMLSYTKNEWEGRVSTFVRVVDAVPCNRNN